MPVDLHLDRAMPRGALRALLIAGIAALGLLAPTAGGAQTGGSDQNLTAQIRKEAPIALPSLAPLVQRVLPAVVNISSQLSEAAQSDPPGETEEGNPSSPLDQFMRKFFENRGMPQLHEHVMALGSGFIIDPAGYIVTNNHVVGNADKITVILQDNTRHPAKIIGRDDKTDLALLKIDTKEKLPFVSWGNSDEAKVGDWVVAVGNPFGLGGTVTAGIISALGRDINEGPYDDFIQIDAPINRGNSGGPTFDLSGQVIGINTAIYSPSGGSVGIGFAVPSNTAKYVIGQLREKGRVTRGWLGVAIQGITPTIARSLGLNPDQPDGALVAAVTPHSPAEKAGIKQGDVIVSAGGHPVKSVHDLPRLVAATPPGRALAVRVLRDRKEVTLEATVAQMPAAAQVASVPGGAEEATSLGLSLSSITPELRRKFSIPKDVEGVVVTHIADNSGAAALGIQPGDVISSIDQEPARTPLQAAKKLQAAATKGSVLLLVNRHGQSQFVGLSVSPGTGSGKPG
ncbi:MAG TPA: DegQ family serine endoprotease [Stellaceae bacterium]|nr:DegQ family serine endoprotease [Stellaceae bacterium]